MISSFWSDVLSNLKYAAKEYRKKELGHWQVKELTADGLDQADAVGDSGEPVSADRVRNRKWPGGELGRS